MATPNPQVDDYLMVGCGRCPLVSTPDCKVQAWPHELRELRQILLDTDLTEERKWGNPCYTYNGGNVVILGALKDNVTLGFFKGVLMNDPDGILIPPGPNSHHDRVIRFTNTDDIRNLEPTLKAYIDEAIRIEASGLKVPFVTPQQMDWPDELVAAFEDDPAFEIAFQALTPGRQKGWLLHFSSAKKAETRVSRIQKAMPKIFEGRGMHDR